VHGSARGTCWNVPFDCTELWAILAHEEGDVTVVDYRLLLLRLAKGVIIVMP